MQNSLPTPIRNLFANRNWTIGLVVLLGLIFIFGSFSQGPEGFAATGLGAQSFFVLSILAFAGGIFSFVSPCTLPILPAYFAFATQSGRSKIATNTIAFMLGVATMFSLLGASASALGRLLLQNQQLLLIVGGAIVMIFGVMSLLGKGFAGMSTQPAGGEAPNTTASGSFAFGLTFSVGWSSCVGPILGVILTLAASTGSVIRGMILLFIYALGLGLPLIIVSTFFGRTSRKSFFWRMLKGRGWVVDVHTFVVATVWALAVWRVLVAVVEYMYLNVAFFNGQSFTLAHDLGLLVLSLAGAALWTFTSTESRRTMVELHTTQLVSGALFVLMAVLMLSGTLASFNALIPPELATWFIGLEDRLIELFQ
ncbi:MAG: cytochrome c biogenesis CcdA family protein [Chloroflexota bacterium]